mmetsp:Transcript_104638/g.337384  ORF Transcript_104638/g.337384 Transcript_104638/m.337384 type:complete len:203 (+) Transcript_104638:57-665(+)
MACLAKTAQQTTRRCTEKPRPQSPASEGTVAGRPMAASRERFVEAWLLPANMISWRMVASGPCVMALTGPVRGVLYAGFQCSPIMRPCQAALTPRFGAAGLAVRDRPARVAVPKSFSQRCSACARRVIGLTGPVSQVLPDGDQFAPRGRATGAVAAREPAATEPPPSFGCTSALPSPSLRSGSRPVSPCSPNLCILWWNACL